MFKFGSRLYLRQTSSTSDNILPTFGSSPRRKVEGGNVAFTWLLDGRSFHQLSGETANQIRQVD